MREGAELGEIMAWAKGIEAVHARVASRFRRPEPGRRVLDYLKGLLSSIQRKNGWQLAEEAGDLIPDEVPRLWRPSGLNYTPPFARFDNCRRLFVPNERMVLVCREVWFNTLTRRPGAHSTGSSLLSILADLNMVTLIFAVAASPS